VFEHCKNDAVYSWGCVFKVISLSGLTSGSVMDWLYVMFVAFV